MCQRPGPVSSRTIHNLPGPDKNEDFYELWGFVVDFFFVFTNISQKANLAINNLQSTQK